MRLLLFSLAAGLSLGSASPPARPWVASVPLDEAMELAMMDVTATFSDAPEIPTPIDPAPIVSQPAAITPPPAPLIPAAPATPLALPPVPAPAPAPAPADDGVLVVVSIPQQKAYVFASGALVATSPVSTGKRGHETPAGTFRILQKKVHHRSNLYSNAPMPYMQRLTHGGIALHAGELPGYPASHGCIRLPWSFAKKLYEMTSFATRVMVTHDSPDTPEDALASL